jgi:methionyl-tRNA formyltransferase
VKIAIVGGVRSTEILINKVVQHGFSEVHVWGYEPTDNTDVSGWYDLRALSAQLHLRYESFNRVADITGSVSKFHPDVLFAVGLSQLIPENMLGVAKVINIGFHPTALPKGRGRAPLAWIILDRVPAAATFFELGLGADDGAILAQVPFEIEDDDDAAAVQSKLLKAEGVALDALLPMLRDGNLRRQEQRHAEASWYGRRTRDDGWIDWNVDADSICRLIKASAPPHPGAFTYFGDSKIVILRASAVKMELKGVVGAIVFKENDCFIVQTGNGLLRISNWSSDSNFQPKVGIRLGFRYDVEIFELRRQVAELRLALASLLGDT